MIYNSPGLDAVSYRIGTFTTFRRAMLDAVANPDLLASAVTSLQADAAIGSTQVTVLDPSGFPVTGPFRIKIGSEYLLVTSSVGATLWTITATTAPHFRGDSIQLVPPNPFAAWHEGIDGDYQTMFVELWAYLGDVLTFYQERIANEAFLGTATQRDSLLRLAGLIDYKPSPGAGASALAAFTVAKGESITIPSGFRVGSRALPGKPAMTYETSTALTATGDNSRIRVALQSSEVQYDQNSIVLAGVNTTLLKGDYLLAVEDESDANSAHLISITAVIPDRPAKTTTIVFNDPRGDYHQASKQVTLYSFSVSAAALGHLAPRWEFLSPLLNNITFQRPEAIFATARWDFERVESSFNTWFYLPTPGDPPNTIFLDGPYDQIKHSRTNPGWAALVSADGLSQVLRVLDTKPVGKSAYGLSANSTRLTFETPVDQFTFPFRSTRVLAGVQKLTLQSELPLPDPLSGDTIELVGIHNQLVAGQTLVFTGDGGAEPVTMNQIVELNTTDQITVVELSQPLVNSYTRASCALFGNIVEVTQGETVKNEILGSGAATAFQAFPVKQSPVTFLPSTDPEGLAAVASTLQVTVNGVVWTEQPNLAASLPGSQVYMTTLDDAGQTTVVFGDGFNGALAPSGSNNVAARYRKGLGASGNLKSGAIQLLVDSLPNLQKITNPIAASGGGDAENSTAIRTQAPASLRTFGRAVSGADYAALALSYPGIGKASANWIVVDPVTLEAVQHPYVRLTVGTLNGTALQGTTLAAKLRRFLDNHRDPNVLLRIQDFTPVYLSVEVKIEIANRFPHQGTLDLVSAALNPGVNSDGSPGYFAFERLQFGQGIFLSDLYAAIQRIPGVKDATVVTLRRVGPGFPDPVTAPPHDIVIGSTEIATIDAGAFDGSNLSITGTGGFADS